MEEGFHTTELKTIIGKNQDHFLFLSQSGESSQYRDYT